MATRINIINPTDTTAPITGRIRNSAVASFWQYETLPSAGNLVPKDGGILNSVLGNSYPTTAVYQAISQGATGVQVGGGNIGIFLNGPDTPLANGVNYWSIGFKIPGRGIYPWAGGRHLRFGWTERFGAVGKFHPDVCGYFSCGMWLRDTVTNTLINFGFRTWDSRDNYSCTTVEAGVALTADGTGIPYAGSDLFNGSPYVTCYHAPCNKGTAVGWQSYTRYGTVSAGQLVALISQFRAMGANPTAWATTPAHIAQVAALANLSLDPANYLLGEFNLQAELASTAAPGVALPVSGSGQPCLPFNLGVNCSNIEVFSWAP